MAATQAGKTFYTDIRRYPPSKQIQEQAHYEIDEVLNASEDFLPFFDVFGSMLKICRNDLVGNIAKLRKKRKEYSQCETFRQLLQYEIDNKLSKNSDSACIAALWYKRTLQFIIAFVEEFLNMKADDQDTYSAFSRAYEVTLKRYHSWIAQKAIGVVAKMLPYKKDVIKKLCFGDASLESQLYEDEKDYITSMRPLADHLHNLIVDLGLDSEDKV